MTRTLLVAAGVHAVDPAADERPRCVLLDGDRIVWLGADPAAAPAAARTVDLGGAWVTPAFVDAHVHATATGLAKNGVDLAGAARGAELLERVRRSTAKSATVLLGTGWDDFRWRDPLPTAADISAAAPGRAVLLTRIDGHSCLVDESVLARLPLADLDGVDRDHEGRPTGWLREQASQAALGVVRSLIPLEDLSAARVAACDAAARVGIGSFHEMGHPGLWGLDDARAWATGEWPVDVDTWWAELDVDVAVANGLRPGGDLFLDGSIGSGTAATSAAYDAAGGGGELFHTDEAVAAWFTACTRLGVGGGVHAIGDRAVEQALLALETASATMGGDAVRACRHRIEHVELATRDQVSRMAQLGVVASVQPAFDAAWGGDDGLYAQRFGVEAARASNPLRWFLEAGVVMAFGSDSTVTPLDPVGALRSATEHRGGLSVPAAVALEAHTAGGHFVGRRDTVGRCAPGYRADLAVWSDDPLGPAAADRVRCLATVVRGVTVHGDV